MPESEAILQAFTQHRRFLWGLCYRMSGCGADADDLVQVAFERAIAHPPPDTDRDLKCWLVRVALNACRDHLRKRRAQSYIGPWLPGPTETPSDDPNWQTLEHAEARYSHLESVSFAFLRAAEALSPAQRGTLLLRDVFDFTVKETAEALEMSEANVKTTLHRARQRMTSYEGARQPITAMQKAHALRTLRALLMHVTTNNLDALRALLREDVIMINDGNGEYFAARRPVVGFRNVSTFLRKTKRIGRAEIRLLNGCPALVAEFIQSKPGLAPKAAMWIELDVQSRVAGIYVSVASRKLQHLQFDTLPIPSLHVVAESLHDAWLLPGHGHWLMPTLRRLGVAGLEQARHRLRQGRRAT